MTSKGVVSSLIAAAVIAAGSSAYAHVGSSHGAVTIAPLAAEPPLKAENVTHVANRGGTTGGHVAREGDRLYVGAYGAGMRIFDISDPADPVQIGAYLPGARADAVPDAARYGKRHLAVLNGTRRVSSRDINNDGNYEIKGTDISEFLDVTDPARPVLLHTFVGQADGEAHNGDLVDDRRLWLPSGGTGANGLRLYDIDPLLEKKPSAPVALFRADPVELWKNSPFYRGDPATEPAFTHTHDIEVYTDYPVQRADGSYARRDIAFMAEGGNYLGSGNTGSVFVVDITEPRQPVVLNRWRNSTGHPIRYYHEVQVLEGDPRVMIVTDEDLHNGCNAGGIATVQLSPDLTGATKLAEWFIGVGTPAPICSAHVFSTKRDFMYIGSYNAGLQIVDLRDPAKPKRAGQYIAPGATSWGALVHEKGYVYVGDMTRGLDVFRFEPPPRRAGKK